MRRKESAFIVAQAAIFIGVITLVALPSQSASQPQISTASVTSPGEIAVSSTDSDGLQLQVSLNASHLAPGQALQVGVDILNTLSATNSVAVSDGWPFQGVPLALWPDCFMILVPNSNLSAPAEAVVLKGDYTIANITSVADIHFPVASCMEGMILDHVVFEPSSAQANVTGIYVGPHPGNGSVGPYHVANMFTTTGYWNLPNYPKGAYFPYFFLDYEQQQAPLRPTATPFTPGIYTVGVEDMWGQALVLHISVEY